MDGEQKQPDIIFEDIDAYLIGARISDQHHTHKEKDE